MLTPLQFNLSNTDSDSTLNWGGKLERDLSASIFIGP